jgi:hypothetical protein
MLHRLTVPSLPPLPGREGRSPSTGANDTETRAWAQRRWEGIVAQFPVTVLSLELNACHGRLQSPTSQAVAFVGALRFLWPPMGSRGTPPFLAVAVESAVANFGGRSCSPGFYSPMLLIPGSRSDALEFFHLNYSSVRPFLSPQFD